MSRHSPLQIATAAHAQQASPEHKRFKTLLAKIEAARERLASWQTQLPLFAQVYAEQVQPLEKKLLAERRAWAFELAQLHASRKWGKADATTIARSVCDVAGGLIESGDEEDAELKALYNQFAEVDFDTEGQQSLQSMKNMMEALGGMDLGDEPVDSVDELMQRAHQETLRQREEQLARQEARAAKAKKKGLTAAEKRAAEEAQRVSQSLREVYRKLAAALHPDRTDQNASDEERKQRTTLMARANAAYEARDLLALLSLQLQIEQVDVAHAATVAASQVKHFNKVLAEQLRELEAEIDERQMAFCASYGFMIEQRLPPDKLGVLIEQELRDIQEAVYMLEMDRRAVRGDGASLKRWLRHQRAEQRLDDNPFGPLFR
jgi:hypothetical protein